MVDAIIGCPHEGGIGFRKVGLVLAPHFWRAATVGLALRERDAVPKAQRHGPQHQKHRRIRHPARLSPICPPTVVHDCKRRIIDTIGCAIAAFDEEPSRIARAVAMRTRRSRAAPTVIGTAHRTLPELAAFANSVASRYHRRQRHLSGRRRPSERLPAADSRDRAGQPAPARSTAITAIVLGYEAHRYLLRAFPMRKHALDYVLYNAVSSAAGAAKVLGPVAAADRQCHRARRGAEPRHRHQPARPSHHVEGLRRRQRRAQRRVRRDHGGRRHGRPADPVRGRPDRGDRRRGDLCRSRSIRRASACCKADYKFFLSEFHAQGPAFLALELRPQIELDDIEKIEVFDLSLRLVRDRQRRGEVAAHHARNRRPQHALCDRGRADRRRLHRRDLCAGAVRRPADACADEEDHDHRGRRIQQALSGEPAVPHDDHVEERRAQDRRTLQSDRPSRAADERRAGDRKIPRPGRAEARASAIADRARSDVGDRSRRQLADAVRRIAD